MTHVVTRIPELILQVEVSREILPNRLTTPQREVYIYKSIYKKTTSGE